MTQHGSRRLWSLAEDLAHGRTTSRALVEECLDRIDDEDGEGARAFIQVSRDRALAAADAMDLLRSRNFHLSPFQGIPISIKDLFDVSGEVTTAGSILLREDPAAEADAPAVARLRRAGFVAIGRSNMTEFAYSGLGLNPHYGTPACPWDRATGRAPGGSTSGGAISVSDGMAHAALGTDTGGSCRIPAAFAGLVGFKPTARRVPLAGIVPLSPTLDSVGPIARTVRCCAILDAILSGDDGHWRAPAPLRSIHIGVPTTIALDGLDEAVACAFSTAMQQLSQAGFHITELAVPEFAELIALNGKGGFPAAESYAWHRQHFPDKRHLYDSRVLSRILAGAGQTAADYVDLVQMRRSIIEKAGDRLAPFDVIAMPTVAIVPPPLADLETDADYARINRLALRNAALINGMDGCAASLPIHAEGEAPVGLMLAACGGRDSRLLAIAATVEQALQPIRCPA